MVCFVQQLVLLDIRSSKSTEYYDVGVMDGICHCGKDEGIVADGAYFDIQGYYFSS